MAHNQERFASFLKKELGVFLQRRFPHDPNVFLSVIDVEVSASAEGAKVYVSVFPENRADEVQKELKAARGQARHYLANRMRRRRRIPKILFIPTNIEHEMRLEKLLEKVKNT